MDGFLRRGLMVVGLCAGAVLPSFGAELSGNVNGPTEQGLILDINRAKALEDLAMKELAAAIASESDLDDEQRLAIAQALQESMEILDQTLSALNSGMLDLQKILTSKKDAAALAANPLPPTACIEPDIKSQRNVATVKRGDILAKRGEARNGSGRGKREKRRRVRSAHDEAALIESLPNYYYSYTGTSTEPGYIFKTLGRPLMGPFDVRFQVGAFDPDATENTGSACVELDLQGSDPLQFFAVCGRRIDGGVQVFAQSHSGQHGNLYLPGARIAQVRIVYTGTTFTCYAADGRDAPDEVLTQFATFDFAQGSTPLVAGIGASGLLKGAEIGLDEIQFIPK